MVSVGETIPAIVFVVCIDLLAGQGRSKRVPKSLWGLDKYGIDNINLK